MYHIYRVNPDDYSLFAWHIYAKNNSDAWDIARAMMEEIVEECDNLAYEIDYQEIQEGLQHMDDLFPTNPNPYREERTKIDEFFKRFDSTIIKQYETMGGYVLDYELFTTMKHGKIKEEKALDKFEYIYEERELFRIEEISEVTMNGDKSLAIPEYNTHLDVKIMINKRNEGELLEWAKPRLNFPCEFAGDCILVNDVTPTFFK
jgi:hypothetical protein